MIVVAGGEIRPPPKRSDSEAALASVDGPGPASWSSCAAQPSRVSESPGGKRAAARSGGRGGKDACRCVAGRDGRSCAAAGCAPGGETGSDRAGIVSAFSPLHRECWLLKRGGGGGGGGGDRGGAGSPRRVSECKAVPWSARVGRSSPVASRVHHGSLWLKVGRCNVRRFTATTRRVGKSFR